MKKWDITLFGVFVLISAGLFFFSRMNREPGQVVVVRVETKVSAVYPLNKDRDIVIEGRDGGINHMIIKDGTVQVSEASCPDLICVYQGTIHLTGQSIICLPNEVIIEIQDDSETKDSMQLDAIVK